MRSRIAPRDTAPAHMDAVHYLNDLIVDMKKRFYKIDGMENTPVNMAYLFLWPEHKRDLLNCDAPRFRFRQIERSERINWDKRPHQEAVDWIDSYILLYPEILNGQREITQEDIDTFERLIVPLRDCERQVKFY